MGSYQSILKRRFSSVKRLFKIYGKPKRKLSYILMNKSRNKKKQKMGDVIGVEKIDRISELPEPIVHQILSLLRCPKDATRTIVLSKKWRNIWTSFLTFDFDQKSFQAQGGEYKEKFKIFVENSLVTRLEPMFCIQKFRLCLTSFDFKLAPHINRWIGSATSKNVKELEINVEVKKKRHYVLPQTVLSAKTISSLKLYGCKLDHDNDIKLSNLQQLSIKKARVAVNVIQCFIRNCPLIEDLRLINCSGFEHLHISTLQKLNRVEVHECHGLSWIHIKLPNLQTFWYHGKKSCGQCKINLAGCEKLKILTLKDTSMTDELFQDQLSKFPVLEKLVLKECNILERITILSGKLKSLALIRCKKLEEKFLGRFDQSKGLKLVVCSNKNVTVHEELREIQFPPFNDFKLELTKSSTIVKDLVDSLLRTSQPKILSIVSSPSSEFLKFVYEKIMNREENPSCCTYYLRKCWQHYLKDVEIEIFEGAENKETSARDCLMPSPTLHQTTTFKLDWRSMQLQKGH